MKIIQRTSRQQMRFIILDDFIAADNPVRILDAFVEKLDLMKLNCKLYKRISVYYCCKG
jgi:transposase